MTRLLHVALITAGACLLILTGMLLIVRRQEAQPPWRVYESNEQGNFELYRVRLDGRQQINLTHHPADDLFLGWGPDGSWLAFASDRFTGDNVVYRMSPYGTDIEAIDESQYPAAPHIGGTTFAASPPIDLPLQTGLMLVMGVVALGASLLPKRLLNG